MSRPKNCTEEVYSLMKQCWNVKATERPPFSYLENILESLFLNVEDLKINGNLVKTNQCFRRIRRISSFTELYGHRKAAGDGGTATKARL